MREIYRILDANFNRAREALRVAEDCGRFALNDPAITAMAKNMRSDLQEIYAQMPVGRDDHQPRHARRHRHGDHQPHRAARGRTCRTWPPPPASG